MPGVEGLVVVDEVHGYLFDKPLVELPFVKVSPVLELDDLVLLYRDIREELLLGMPLLSDELEEHGSDFGNEGARLLARVALAVLQKGSRSVKS